MRLICLMLGVVVGFWTLVPVAANGEEAGTGDHPVEYTEGAAGGGDGHASDAAGHKGGSPNPLSADPDLMIFTAIIFLVLLAVLRKFAWGPIRDALDARERAVANQIAAAERQNEQARQLLADHETKLASATEEVRTLLDEGRREAEAQKQRIVAEAAQAAAAEKDRALLAIEAAKNNALQDIAQQSVDTAVSLAGRIVGEKLNSADHGKLIREALDHFPSQN